MVLGTHFTVMKVVRYIFNHSDSVTYKLNYQKDSKILPQKNIIISTFRYLPHFPDYLSTFLDTIQYHI